MKKPSYRELAECLKSSNEEARGYLAQLLAARQELQRERATTEHVRGLLNQKVDTSMIDARTKLASQVGQMVEACTRMVGYVVAKESL